MKIAFIGIGQVGSALAGRLVALGHQVTIAARDPESERVKAAIAQYPALQVALPPLATADAEIVFLATQFDAYAAAIAGAGDLSGKILVDCTNPVGPNLSHGVQSQRSGAEAIQQVAPTARVVKAFTIYGVENLGDNAYPGYGDLKPAMLIAGDDLAAKQAIADLCQAMDWEPVDVGRLAMSLHLEHMTLLWIQMARVQKRGTGFVWAMLNR